MAGRRDHVVLFGTVFVYAAAVMILLSFFAPRFIALSPAIIALAGFAAYPRVFGGLPSLYKPLLLWGGALLVLAGLSTLWAYDPSITLNRTAKMIPVFAGSLLLATLAARLPVESYRRALWALPLVVGLCLALVMFEILSDLAIYRALRGYDAEMRITHSVMNRPMTMSALFLFPCLAILWHASWPRLRRYGAIAGLLVLMMAAITVANSESAALAAGLGALFFLLFPYRWKPAWVIAALVFAAGVMSAPWSVQWVFTNFAAEINGMTFLGHGDGYGAERLEIYDFVARYALQSPFWGFGIESARVIKFDSAALYYGAGDIFHPHNFALQLWIEFGAIGAAFVAVFSSYLLWKIYQMGPGLPQRFAMASFIAFFAVASVSHNIWHGWWLGVMAYLIAILLLIGPYMRASSEQQKVETS